jgi:hypothetical protein
LLLRVLLVDSYHATVTQGGITAVDFKIYYDAACRLKLGQPLYQDSVGGFTYVYPPLLAFILKPFVALPMLKAFQCWYFVNAALLLGSISIFSLAIKLRWQHTMLFATFLLMAFRFWPSEMCFAFGQTNFFLLFFVALMYLSVLSGRMQWFALWVAISALIKPWMFGLLLYPIIRRRWLVVVSSVALFLIGLVCLFIPLGWNEFRTYFDLTFNFVNQKSTDHFPSESILGFARLHFAHNSYVQPLCDNHLIFWAFIIICMSPIIFAFVRAFILGEKLNQPLLLSLVMVTTLLLSPLLETYYFVLLLPVFWSLLWLGVEQKRPWQVIATVLVYLLFTKGWPTFIPIRADCREGIKTLLVSAEFFWTSALWLVLAASLGLHRRSIASVQEASE